MLPILISDPLPVHRLYIYFWHATTRIFSNNNESKRFGQISNRSNLQRHYPSQHNKWYIYSSHTNWSKEGWKTDNNLNCHAICYTSQNESSVWFVWSYCLRLTRSWYFRKGSSTNQFLLFQKDVVILSKSLHWVLLQNTCSLRRFFLAGSFFHSFFLYPALRLIQRPQCNLINLSVTDGTDFRLPFFTL